MILNCIRPINTNIRVQELAITTVMFEILKQIIIYIVVLEPEATLSLWMLTV